MLARLRQSGPGTKWFSLWDKVTALRNLEAGFWSVWRKDGAPGVDGQTVAGFEAQWPEHIRQLSQELCLGRYEAAPARRKWIPKPGTVEKRPLGIPVVRDRTVQAALKHVLEPIFEHDFAQQSYGFRPGRGCPEAVKRVEELLRQGHTVVVDVDLKSYFDTIPHERLMKKIQERVADGKVLELIRQYLKAGVLDELRDWQPTESGTPQGSVISPLLSNIYLNELDHAVAARGWQMVRYADDFVVLCPDKAQAEAVLNYLRQWTEAAGLTLHPTKTRVVDYGQGEGFDFLGWHFEVGHKWPRTKSQKKLRDTVREKTPRNLGVSLATAIESLNRSLRGWWAYFGASPKSRLRREDEIIRRRLRALLRKRAKRPGSGRTLKDHHQWRNRWFAKQGLFSLEHGSCEYG
ncbi:MAG: group II intron reverse transcriptase/maturase [Luteolibacter sp.]